MHYQISILNTQTHFIELIWTIDYVHQDTLYIQLPSWRPGRYELQNYIKNVRCFSIADENGNEVPFKKVTKDKWEVNTSKLKKIFVTYQYYANQLDAGASFVNNEFLYINPVNCFMYVEGRMDEEYTLHFSLPKEYVIACQLPTDNHTLIAKNFDTLADSPLIASANIHHYVFEINANVTRDIQNTSKIHFWFQGEPYNNIQKLIDETIAYTNEQVALFGDLPSHDFHFLYLLLPILFRHGVEHSNSTVIAMGPAVDWYSPEFYDSFIAISSHEFFHLWNIKRIRPSDMLPYDFSKENYSNLGYVYEGLTTYYGDVILLRSSVWNWEQYCKSFNNNLQKHISNLGRFNYSVAESSFDTWIDGYTPGTLGRKVSIYIEGMLAAFIADVIIISNSKGKFSLDNVMKDLYNLYYKNDLGYSEIDYKNILERYSGVSFDDYFNEIIWGKNYFNKWLKIACHSIGCELNWENATLIKKDSLSNIQKENFQHWVNTRVAFN